MALRPLWFRFAGARRRVVPASGPDRSGYHNPDCAKKQGRAHQWNAGGVRICSAFDSLPRLCVAFRLGRQTGARRAMLDRPLARIENLRVEFETRDGRVVGVEDVSFAVNPGETVCIVGESGSGKSVSSLSLMRLIEYGGGTIAGGRMLFDRREGGEIDLVQTDQGLMRTIRGNEIGMIFQEPMTALNPVFTVGRQLSEGLDRKSTC